MALAWLGWRVSEVAKLQSSPGLELPMSYVYYGMVVGGLTSCWSSCGASSAAPGLRARGDAGMIWVMLGLLLATMLIGIPILLCIALIGFIGIAAEPGVVMPMFAQKSFAQLDSYTLLALPFFILAGALMTAGGMSQQLVDFSRVLVGHLRAGLAHASVVAR